MDPLSEVLALLNTQSSFFAGLKAGGDWAIDFPAPDGIKFNAVVEGACWLSVEGVAQAIRLERGDCFLLSRRRTFSLRSDPGLPAVPADQVYRHAVQGIARWHGRWVLPDRRALRVRRGRRFAGRRTAARRRGQERIGAGGGAELALRRLAHELAHASPGGAIVIQHLGHIMLVEMLRLYLERGGDGAPSWLLAVSDPRRRGDPGDPRRSRARLDRRGAGRGRGRIAPTLALHFKRKAGIAPLEYCCAGACNWRRAR